MRIDFDGTLIPGDEIRAGFIGCGSHSFRNIYPTFQFVPVALTAVCDLSVEKAQRFADTFGAASAYSDYREMLAKEKLDAVFIVTGYDELGRPLYPRIAADCINAGCHVWIEKPPAADENDLIALKELADRKGKIVCVGFKKMFYPATEKAKALAYGKDFGNISLVTINYPQKVPAVEQFKIYIDQKQDEVDVRNFLDHLCHPVSLMVYLLGMPASLYYERNRFGAGVAIFKYESGVIAAIHFTHGSSMNGGMERTVIISDSEKHIVIENNTRLCYFQNPPDISYGNTPSFYTGDLKDTASVWEPEFSLGQLYNKGLFLLGYFNEINEFATAVLEGRNVKKGHIGHAIQITQIFSKFAAGPGIEIKLSEEN